MIGVDGKTGTLVRTWLASEGGTIGKVREVILFFRWYVESGRCGEKRHKQSAYVKNRDHLFRFIFFHPSLMPVY